MEELQGERTVTAVQSMQLWNDRSHIKFATQDLPSSAISKHLDLTIFDNNIKDS